MDITEGVKKIFLAGVGAVASTGEAAKNLIDNLVEKGEITVEQGKVLNEELKHNAKEKFSKHVTVNVVNEYKDVFSAVEKMSKEELESLKAKLAEAEAKTSKEETCCAGTESCSCDSENSGEDNAAKGETCGCGDENKPE